MTRVRPGLRAIGQVSWGPVYPVYGAAGGVDFIVDDKDGDDDPFEDEEEDDGAEEEDDEEERPRARRTRGNRGGDGEGDEEELPSRDEIERMRAALRRNNAENKRLRLAAKILTKIGAGEDLAAWLVERGIDPESGSPLGQQQSGDQDQPEEQPEQQPSPAAAQRQIRQAEARGAARVEMQYKPLVAEFAARSALADAGWSGRNTEMVMRLIDLDLVEVEVHDGHPVVLGVDDQVREIKEEFPEWFQSSRRTNGNGGRRRSSSGGAEEADAGNRGRSRVQPRGWLQQASEALMGQQPR